MLRAENRIDYVEIPVTDLKKAKVFFTALFGWSFQEWGDDYLSFNDGQLDGGFCRAQEPVAAGGVVLIFYSANLERDVVRVEELGATISQAVFTFPGGRRFHFIDPTGTEYAFWSDRTQAETGD